MGRITLADIQAAGVAGAGGAGFPTHVKLSGRCDTVIINAAECEPLLHKDKEILRSRGEMVLAGLAAAMGLTGAKVGIVAVKGKYVDVIDGLGPLSGPGMSIRPLADAYPAGDEQVLVYDVLGRLVRPGGIPLDVGAVVMNVETALNVAGAADGPVTEKFVTVAGAVAGPVTLRVPVGTSLAGCVAAAGGATVERPAYVVGGVMMGYLEDNPQAVVDKTTGGIVVLPDEHVVVRRRRRDRRQMARIGRSACDQCTFCTELCPRYLLGHPVQPHLAMRNLGFNLAGQASVPGAAFCCGCNLCSLYSCPEDLDPKDVCAENKRRLLREGTKWLDPPFNPRRPAMHMANRRAPMRRLMTKLDLVKFDNTGPIDETPVATEKVGIKLKQHVGAECQPLVEPGQAVSAGDVVGRPAGPDGKDSLGATVHASVGGRVLAIEDGVVWIVKG